MRLSFTSRLLMFSITLMGGNVFAMTLAEETTLGRAAGEYYGSVAMNQEFKKSVCGEYLKIPTAWYDTTYAMDDIKKTVPNTVKDKAQILKTMPKDVEPLRMDVRQSVVGLNDQQCRVLAKRLYNITTPAIIKWMDIK